MKKFISSFLLCFALLEVYGQVNLVPNPSFEERTGCPQGFPDLDGTCNDWMSFRESPDYFNNCSSVCGYDNVYGYQPPHLGEAYAGILTYGVTIPNLREHIGIELISPLNIGEKYFVSFFVSTAWNYFGMNIATNKTGALFTSYAYLTTGDSELPNFSHISTNSIITDTINWTKVTGSFIADSSYSYITIGNFYDDLNIDTLNLPYQQIPQRSYYYIDNICVSTDSIYTNNWLETKFLEPTINVLIYPNPANEIINIQCSHIIKSIELVNKVGEIIDYNKNIFDLKTSLTLKTIAPGVYYLKITTSNSVITKKILIS